MTTSPPDQPFISPIGLTTYTTARAGKENVRHHSSLEMLGASIASSVSPSAKVQPIVSGRFYENLLQHGLLHRDSS